MGRRPRIPRGDARRPVRSIALYRRALHGKIRVAKPDLPAAMAGMLEAQLARLQTQPLDEVRPLRNSGAE